MKPAKRTSDITTSGHDLADERKRAGMTQQELADELGLSQPYIAMCERGERRLPDDRAVSLFRALKRSLDARRRDQRLMKKAIAESTDVAMYEELVRMGVAR